MGAISRIIHWQATIKGRGLRIEAMGLVLAMRGISNRRSQISNLPFEICNLTSRRESLRSSKLIL
jgi:hypothetical protein